MNVSWLVALQGDTLDGKSERTRVAGGKPRIACEFDALFSPVGASSEGKGHENFQSVNTNRAGGNRRSIKSDTKLVKKSAVQRPDFQHFQLQQIVLRGDSCREGCVRFGPAKEAAVDIFRRKPASPAGLLKQRQLDRSPVSLPPSPPLAEASLGAFQDRPKLKAGEPVEGWSDRSLEIVHTANVIGKAQTAKSPPNAQIRGNMRR